MLKIHDNCQKTAPTVKFFTHGWKMNTLFDLEVTWFSASAILFFQSSRHLKQQVVRTCCLIIWGPFEKVVVRDTFKKIERINGLDTCSTGCIYCWSELKAFSQHNFNNYWVMKGVEKYHMTKCPLPGNKILTSMSNNQHTSLILKRIILTI